MKRRIPPGTGYLVLVLAACAIFLWFIQAVFGGGRNAEIERILSAGRKDGPGASRESPPPGVDPKRGLPNIPW